MAIDQRAQEDEEYAREERAGELKKLREMYDGLQESKQPLPGSRLLRMHSP